MRQKHILFISSWYPNRNNPTHGIFNRYFAEAAALNNKVSVLHVCSDVNLISNIEVEESADNDNIFTVVLYYRKIKENWPLITSLKKMTTVKELFDKGFKIIESKKGRPDLIQLNVIWPMGVGVQYLSRKYNIPYVINENWTGYAPEDGNYKGIGLKYFTKKIVSDASALLPVTRYLEALMTKHGLKGKYVIVPNVVNTERFVPFTKMRKDRRIRFLHISTLDDAQKNVSGIIRSFSSAFLLERDIELHIVGDGNDRPMLESLARTSGAAKNIFFKGRLMGSELVDEINSCDALLMFSNYETFCLVIAEGFACGKPVVTSNAGGIASYMNPQLGVMVPRKDEGALTAAITTFIQRQHEFDPKAIRLFAIDNFSSKVVGEKLSAVYNEVCGK